MIQSAFDCGHPAHIGGALSIVDILTVLYESVLKHDYTNPMWPERDIFILSKGHTVLAHLAVLHMYRFIDDETLATFQTNGSKLIAHPIKNLDIGIESSNGSLGQGISYASGMALGFKMRNRANRVFTVLGDGECNEGSVWEAAQFAAENKLNNLTAIIDVNGMRNDGETAYHGTKQLADMWRSFGWKVIAIDGHDYDQILGALKDSSETSSCPVAVVAKTTKGKGFTFMEGNNDWHHNRITELTYQKCIAELEVTSEV